MDRLHEFAFMGVSKDGGRVDPLILGPLRSSKTISWSNHGQSLRGGGLSSYFCRLRPFCDSLASPPGGCSPGRRRSIWPAEGRAVPGADVEEGAGVCGIPPLFRRDHYLRGRGALISPGAGAPGSLRCKSARVVELPAPERLKRSFGTKNRRRRIPLRFSPVR